MVVTYFVIVGANDSAIFEHPVQEESAASRSRQFRIHAALDMVDAKMWQNPGQYMPRVDVVEERLPATSAQASAAAALASATGGGAASPSASSGGGGVSSSSVPAASPSNAGGGGNSDSAAAAGGGGAAPPSERFYISAYVGYGPIRLLLMQDTEPYDTVQRFFVEAYELVVKHLMNPFSHPAAPIQRNGAHLSGQLANGDAFRDRFERIFCKYF